MDRQANPEVQGSVSSAPCTVGILLIVLFICIIHANHLNKDRVGMTSSLTYQQPMTKTFNFITIFMNIFVYLIIGSLYSLHNGFHSMKCSTNFLLCLLLLCSNQTYYPVSKSFDNGFEGAETSTIHSGSREIKSDPAWGGSEMLLEKRDSYLKM